MPGRDGNVADTAGKATITGCIRMFGQDATTLFDAYMIGLLERLQRAALRA